ncbi:MAG: hypothetical protein JST33_15765 [Actinobacteria bacterium]|nr:hypothetical protein [Actinomycetota bacterium]
MSPIRTLAAIAASTVLVLGAALPAQAAPPSSPDDDPSAMNRIVATVRAATAKYHDVNRALADGYVPIGECAESPAGAMGVHYMNEALIKPGAPVDPATPAFLTYGPSPSGRAELWAAEFFEPEVGQPHPMLGSQPFDGPMPGHEPGMPTHYDLHVWVGKHNPAGLFAAWNPNLHC